MGVRIDPSAQLRLLDLAAVDVMLGQLRHQRETLPALKQIAGTQAALDEVRGRLVDRESSRSDLGREMTRLETDIDAVRNRQVRNSDRLTSGAIKGSKDLEALGHENVTLRRRQGELEDQELELMERAEALDSDIAAAQSSIAELDGQLAAASAERDAEWARIDGLISAAEQRRTEVTADIPADLVTLYERLSDRGVGAAPIVQRRCGGCRIDLSGSDLARLRAFAPDEIARCDECGCIQVRTAESGL